MLKNIERPTALGGSLAALIVLSASEPLGAAMLTAHASMHDTFATAPDVIDAPPPLIVPALVGGTATPSISATARDPETGGGGTALAKGGEFDHDSREGHVEVGVAAAARSQGNRVGSARASALIDFEIRVEITLPPSVDPVFGILSSYCRADHACDLTADFLHQTTGSFIYSSLQTSDASAQFSERVAIDDKSVAGTASVTGGQGTGSDAVTVGAGGAWRLFDFFPAIDTGSESVLNFNHFERISDVPGKFINVEGEDDIIFAIYTAQIAQEAVAGFGSANYVFGSIAADFAHTSRLSVAGIHDPVSGLDLSGLEFRVSYRDLSQVPLPAPVGLLAPTVLGLGLRVRRQASARLPTSPG